MEEVTIGLWRNRQQVEVKVSYVHLKMKLSWFSRRNKWCVNGHKWVLWTKQTLVYKGNKWVCNGIKMTNGCVRRWQMFVPALTQTGSVTTCKPLVYVYRGDGDCVYVCPGVNGHLEWQMERVGTNTRTHTIQKLVRGDAEFCSIFITCFIFHHGFCPWIKLLCVFVCDCFYLLTGSVTLPVQTITLCLRQTQRDWIHFFCWSSDFTELTNIISYHHCNEL